MTAYVILQIRNNLGIQEHNELIRILPQCTRMNGTSANLIPCDYLNVWELLHGMMLPSGNDAA